MKNIIVCFTGHRPQSLPFGFNEQDERCFKLKSAMREEIIRLIEKSVATKFISGMAIGIDIFAAEIVIDLKKQYPKISLECAIPCESQPEKWRESDRNRYFKLITCKNGTNTWWTTAILSLLFGMAKAPVQATQSSTLNPKAKKLL
ncbi:MAG: SLOG family protein [Oscillospiraceae bacterium]